MANSNSQRSKTKELSPGVKRVWAEWDALAADVSLSEDELMVALFQSVFDHADEMSLAELADFRNNAAALLNDFENELSARGIPWGGKIIQP